GASAYTRLDAFEGTHERAEHDRDPWPPAGEIVGRYQTLQPVGERAVGYEVDCRRRAGVGRQRALDDPDVRLEHQLASHPRLDAEPVGRHRAVPLIDRERYRPGARAPPPALRSVPRDEPIIGDDATLDVPQLPRARPVTLPACRPRVEDLREAVHP